MAALRRAAQELDPAWRAARDTERRITADRGRVARILSTHPHPDPLDRDPAARGDALAARLTDASQIRHAAAWAAQERATTTDQARGRLTRVMAAFGVTTPAQHAVDQAMTEAERLADAARSRRPTRSDLRDVRGHGEALAYAAQRTTRAWESRPDVAQALEQHRLNGAVQTAVAMGDQAVTSAMAAGDPEAARAIIRAREQQEERQVAERERLAEARQGQPGQGGSSPPGPRKK